MESKIILSLSISAAPFKPEAKCCTVKPVVLRKLDSST